MNALQPRHSGCTVRLVRWWTAKATNVLQLNWKIAEFSLKIAKLDHKIVCRNKQVWLGMHTIGCVCSWGLGPSCIENGRICSICLIGYRAEPTRERMPIIELSFFFFFFFCNVTGFLSCALCVLQFNALRSPQLQVEQKSLAYDTQGKSVVARPCPEWSPCSPSAAFVHIGVVQ